MSHTSVLAPLHADWRAVDLPFAKLVRSFVSGDPEGDRIRVRYFRSQETDILWGRVWFGPGAEGPPGHCHGGAQAAVLDEICGGCVWIYGHKVVAVNLETEFVSFVPLETELTLRGAIIGREGRKITTEGRIEDASGRLLARARVVFLELNEEQLARFQGYAKALAMVPEMMPPLPH